MERSPVLLASWILLRFMKGHFEQRDSGFIMSRSTGPSCGSRPGPNVHTAIIGYPPHQLIMSTGGYFVPIIELFLLGNVTGFNKNTCKEDTSVIIQICYGEQFYICFAQNKEKWLIYDFDIFLHRSFENCLRTSDLDKTHEDDQQKEENEALAADWNSGTLLDKKSSDPIVEMDEIDVSKIAARIANAELDKKGTSGQSAGEIASSSSCQRSVNVDENNNADKVLLSLRVIIQSLCNLKNLFLTEAPKWNPYSENPCIGDMLYGIFFAWERYEPYPTIDILTSPKNIVRRLADDSCIYEKVGESFASKTVITILMELHMSETSLSFSSNTESEEKVVNPITCGDCICPTHNLFGINFDAQMSCSCGKCSDKYLYTTLFHILDAGSPQTTKIKSFAELQYILDHQFSVDNTCEHGRTMENVGLFLSNTPHCFTIVLNWASGSESQDTLSAVLAGITYPLDAKFFCRSSHSATKYIVASMICYAGERYVCFARDEEKWLIYDAETVTIDIWEHLLESFKDCKLQPEILFFEVIK